MEEQTELSKKNGIQQGIKVIAVWVHTQTVLHLIKYIAFRKVVAI